MMTHEPNMGRARGSAIHYVTYLRFDRRGVIRSGLNAGRWIINPPLKLMAARHSSPMKSLPKVHLLTCARRASTCAETLTRWANTDWPDKPRVHVDPAKEEDAPEWGTSARAERITDAFAGMLRAALAEPQPDDRWLLFLEDDLDFHPRIAERVCAWEALTDPHCSLASLFNPSLRPMPLPSAPPNAFAAEPSSFLGGQALLLRRSAAVRALAEWESLRGMQSQRLATLLGKEGPIWVHKPSLVQHVAEDSSWGARVQRALDFRLVGSH